MSAVRFVLVRPRNPLNIGACARALANFGFSDLLAVDPFEAVWKETKSAVGGEAVLEKARAVSLDEALDDRQVVLGTHDGRRKSGPPVVDLPELRAWLPSGRLAVLFGPEKTGLANEELSRCHAVLRIPTDAGCPSMNLAQAVAVVAYELKRAPGKAGKETLDPTTHGQREDLIKSAVSLCRKMHVKDDLTDSSLADGFRRLLLRWTMSGGEAARLQLLLRRLNDPEISSKAR